VSLCSFKIENSKRLPFSLSIQKFKIKTSTSKRPPFSLKRPPVFLSIQNSKFKTFAYFFVYKTRSLWINQLEFGESFHLLGMMLLMMFLLGMVQSTYS